MVFGLNSESTGGARTPGEELEMIHGRIQERQERLNTSPKSPEDREHIASQELAAYHAESPEDVLAPDMQMSEQDVALEARTISSERGRQMDELLETLVEKGLKNTLSIVDKISNPHLTDDFHRFLVQYLAEGMDIRGLEEGTLLFKALHMKLFEVTLPNITDVEDQNFKQLVRAMEQFYSGMLSIHEKSRIRRYFTLEIALSSSSDDVTFYVAVPTSKVALFEKQIMATFPNAQVTASKQDYNPFNTNGMSAGSIGKLTRAAALPLKTFDLFEQDPLNVILGVFSKMKRHGEGAAIQLVIAPSGGEMNKKYQEVLKDVKKGTSLNIAMEGIAMKISREVFATAKQVFFGGDTKKKEEEKEKKALDVDEEEVKAITEKISSPIIHVNLRIIGSADTKARAEEIVADLESAFHQFSNEPSNSIGFRKMNEESLKQLLHDFSFRLYSEKYAMPLNLKEVTTMFHFPVTNTVSAELKQSKLLSAPAPVNMETQGVFLGVNNHRGIEKNVHFAQEDRMRHFYVIGQTGTGKTTLLKNMIIQDIVNGEGVCYIDPHGTDIEDILNAVPPHRKQDVIYFDPSDTERPMGLNMLEYDLLHPEQKSFVINEMLSIFNKLFDMKVAGGPMFEQYFRNATALVMEDPSSGNTLLDVSRVLADPKFREMKLLRCKNPIVVQFWREVAGKAGGESSLANMVPYITNKFDVFLSNDIMRTIVAQEKSSFNFRDVMDTRKILLVNLAKGRLGDINSHLIGLILVGKLLMAALSRVDVMQGAKPADFYMYIDEFQNVTTDSISSILSEARKYRLSLTMAHQFIAQLDEDIRDSVFGNVGSMAVFRVGAEDAEYLESQFAPVFAIADIMKIPNRNAYVKMLINGFPAKPFNMETVAPFTGSPEIGREIKDLSRRTYGRDRAVIEAVIAEKYAPPAKAQAPVAQAATPPVRIVPPQQSVVPPQTMPTAVVRPVQTIPLHVQAAVQSFPVSTPMSVPSVQQQVHTVPPPRVIPLPVVQPLTQPVTVPESAVVPKPAAPAPVVPVAQVQMPQQKPSSVTVPPPSAVAPSHAQIISQTPRRAGAPVYTNPFADDRPATTPFPVQTSASVAVPAYGFPKTSPAAAAAEEPQATSMQDDVFDSFFGGVDGGETLKKEEPAPVLPHRAVPQKPVVPVAPATPAPPPVTPAQVSGVKHDPYREIPE